MEKAQKEKMEQILEKEIQKCFKEFKQENSLKPKLGFYSSLTKTFTKLPLPMGLFNSPGGKELIGEQLKAMVTELELSGIPIERILFVGEVWMSMYDKDVMEDFKAGKIPRPSKDPNKKECIIATIESKTDNFFRAWVIERDKDGKPILAEEPTQEHTSKKEQTKDRIMSNFEVW